LKLKSLIVLLALAGCAHGADTPFTQAVGPFGGLNTNISQEALDSTQSPDLLNVDISPGGKSVKKRQGYGLDATLTISTSAVHNLYKFFDASGNEVRLAFNDNRVSSSVNGAAWSVILTTGTAGATWDCTDYLGYAYCVSSSFDYPIKTNGTTAGTTGVGGTNGVPSGSLISNSGDRLLVGATAANPSRLYYSQSAVFTNFTLGIQPSDSSFEDIVAPGSKLTHLAYRFGRWLWWKDQSFGFIVGTGQFDLQIITVSNTIGTFDNTDVFDGNYVYFRGSDGQIYTYDGSVLSRSISTDISPTLKGINRRKANSWIQTTQADFQTGISSPSGYVSTSISPGDVTVSSFTFYADSQTWNVPNNGFEQNGGAFTSTITSWTNSGYTGGITVQNHLPSDSNCGSIAPRTGSYFLALSTSTSFQSPFFTIKLIDANDGSTLYTQDEVYTKHCSWVQDSLNTSTLANGKSVKLRFELANGNSVVTSSSFTLGDIGTALSFYLLETQGPSSTEVAVDDTFNGETLFYSTGSISTGYAQSYGYSSTVGTSSVTVQESTNNVTGPWTTVLTSTGTSGFFNQPYIRFVSSFTRSASDSAGTDLKSVTLNFITTGTYLSAVENAPNLTSWNTVSINDVSGSSITYFTRSSTSPFSIASSTPSWVSQAKNATVSASTGTYFQLKAEFSVLSATSPPTLNDFTFNWYEGAASDKMYATYFNNGIWFSLSLGTSATNNRIFRYDLLSNLWTLYDIPSNGFATYNNGLYFGDPSAGNIYQFGNSVTSDNGSAINAYWKSKAFFGDSPFSDKDLRLASWYIGASSGTTLNLTYTLDESSTIAKSINLFDSRRNVIQSNWNFPMGSIATNFNAQFGDNSTNPGWEVFGGVINGVSRPWRVYP